ncbi:C39 family peptidase [Tumebacillus sp. DT12]|uniref:C39 family peptidase n=1 Tax=Tumebacillus lacus TaxID=2995335 RepID=A0ABT3X514_9BACL|nr:C39 family peptidase [Tumebacillus lacus]MCX7571062.1 C39 family peptidase [Tumebacillus lacus]
MRKLSSVVPALILSFSVSLSAQTGTAHASSVAPLLPTSFLEDKQQSAVVVPSHTVLKVPQRYLARQVERSDNRVLIHTPAIRQHPELRDGCEVTSLAMLLQAVGQPGDKMKLAHEVRKDPTPVRRDARGRIVFWGDPKVGFVGAVDGKPIGFGVYHAPIADLLNQYLPGQAHDMTGQSFQQVLARVAEGKPVVVWTTVPLRAPDYWDTWDSPTGRVRTTWNEHAVLLVGYGPDCVYINDPFDGTKAKRVERARFEQSWIAMGMQAVTVR